MDPILIVNPVTNTMYQIDGEDISIHSLTSKNIVSALTDRPGFFWLDLNRDILASLIFKPTDLTNGSQDVDVNLRIIKAGSELSVFSTETDSITVTGDLSLSPSTNLDSSLGVVAGTLGGGSFVGQLKHVTMTDASNASTLVITSHEFGLNFTYQLDALNQYVLLSWSGREWTEIKSTANAYEVLTVAGAVSIYGSTHLEIVLATGAMTLADGVVDGQIKIVTMTVDNGTATVKVAHHEGSTDVDFVLTAVNDIIILMWTAGEWYTLKDITT